MLELERIMSIVGDTLADEFSDLTDVEQGTRVTLRLMLAALLGGLLGGNSQPAPQAPQQGALGMLGGLLDADGDGNAMDDIFQMVMKFHTVGMELFLQIKL